MELESCLGRGEGKKGILDGVMDKQWLGIEWEKGTLQKMGRSISRVSYGPSFVTSSSLFLAGHSLLFALVSTLPSLKFHSPTRNHAGDGCQVNRRMAVLENKVLLEKAEKEPAGLSLDQLVEEVESMQRMDLTLYEGGGRDLIYIAFY